MFFNKKPAAQKAERTKKQNGKNAVNGGAPVDRAERLNFIYIAKKHYRQKDLENKAVRFFKKVFAGKMRFFKYETEKHQQKNRCNGIERKNKNVKQNYLP